MTHSHWSFGYNIHCRWLQPTVLLRAKIGLCMCLASLGNAEMYKSEKKQF